MIGNETGGVPLPKTVQAVRAVLALSVLAAWVLVVWRIRIVHILPPRPVPLQRPYGMAPTAFTAYLKACQLARVDSRRIGQTIGDDPRSHGYHKQDGVVLVHGEAIPYSAATDLGIWDLSDHQIHLLVIALARNGFACWYRHGGHWKGDEHIHAVYMHLAMKRQLRRQVRQFKHEHRLA